MNLVFIYGPPAVGKLSVAKKVAMLAGYKLFPNQATIDFLAPVLSFGTQNFFRLNERIRLMVFQSAVSEKVQGLVFTFCYSSPEDNLFVRKVIRTLRGKVCFVQLYCDKDALLHRVRRSGRRGTKIRTARKLEEALGRWNLSSRIDFAPGLSIDNTHLTPEKVARRIVRHFRLRINTHASR